MESAKRINVIVIDDENYLYHDWKKINPNVKFTFFNYFDDFFDDIDSKSIELNNVDLILTDYYFDKIRIGLTLLTTDYLSSLKNIHEYNGFIVLASNLSVANNFENIDIVIDKKPRNIELLIEEITNKSLPT